MSKRRNLNTAERNTENIGKYAGRLAFELAVAMGWHAEVPDDAIEAANRVLAKARVNVRLVRKEGSEV